VTKPRSRQVRPGSSRSRVNAAGRAVRAGVQTSDDIEVIENWRKAHNKVLNDWQASLRAKCKNREVTFAQRLKRRRTIFDKLARQPGMELCRMHDIVGCRLIFPDMESLYDFRTRFLQNRRSAHEHLKVDRDPYPYDYIQVQHPTGSGYRGVHDIFRYVARSQESKPWDGLQIEIQYRTEAQHAWATAVEIAGAITRSETKFGKGSEAEKDFFRLSSEMIARSAEGMSSCYPELSNTELIERFDEIESKTGTLRHLRHVKMAETAYTEMSKQGESKAMVLVFRPENLTLAIYGFADLSSASNYYFGRERENSEEDIVLVRVAGELKKAYENYFSDTTNFIHLMDRSRELLK